MLDALICINTHKLICPTGQHNTLVENKSLPPQPRGTLIRRAGISSTTAFCTARIFPVSLMRAVTKKWKEACSNTSLMYSLDLITMSKELAEGRHRKQKRCLKESNHYLLLPSWPVPVTWVPGKKKVIYEPTNGFDCFFLTNLISLLHHFPSIFSLFPFRLWVSRDKGWVCAQPLSSTFSMARSLLKVSGCYHKINEKEGWKCISTGHKGPNQLLYVIPVNVCSFDLLVFFLCLSSWYRDATRADNGGCEPKQATWEITCSPGHGWISAFVLPWNCLQNLARRSSCHQHALQRAFTCLLTIIIGRNESL